jgi:hypothetical protein
LAKYPNINPKANKIVTILIGFQDFGEGIELNYPVSTNDLFSFCINPD